MKSFYLYLLGGLGIYNSIVFIIIIANLQTQCKVDLNFTPDRRQPIQNSLKAVFLLPFVAGRATNNKQNYVSNYF